MVVETDDKEERTEEDGETPSIDSALIGWLGAMHAEMRAMRVEFREELQATRAEMRDEIREVSGRVSRLEERVTRIEAGIEAERARKNRAIMWLGIAVATLAALATAAGVIIGVISLLN